MATTNTPNLYSIRRTAEGNTYCQVEREVTDEPGVIFVAPYTKPTNKE